MTLEEMEKKLNEIEENHKKEKEKMLKDFEEKLEEKDKELEEVKKKKLEVELINKGKTIDNEIDESEKVVTWEDILKDKIEID